jgi:hypothetical protein
MKTPMAPNIALAIIAFTAVATVALRAAARRPGPTGHARHRTRAGHADGR